MSVLLGIQMEFLQDFKISEADLALKLRDPIMQDLARRAIRVEAAAKRYATGEGGGPQVRTGRLRSSITWVPGEDSMSPFIDIGTSVNYAPYVEFGHNNTAHAYPITAPGGGATGEFGYVSSNPTPAYPFLRPAAMAARTE